MSAPLALAWYAAGTAPPGSDLKVIKIELRIVSLPLVPKLSNLKVHEAKQIKQMVKKWGKITN
eukprot:1141997-Amphidinium_carterae.1